MTQKTQVLCIGSVLYDVVGRTDRSMQIGSDVPGKISRIPGGVALNVAMTLARLGTYPALLSAVGLDAEGQELVRHAKSLGLETKHLFRSSELPTDIYMAIEAKNGLIAAIADAHSLEAAGSAILEPLRDGRLGDIHKPFRGSIILDGNLTRDLLAEIAADNCFAKCDLRIAPASPGKADRLSEIILKSNVTLYVNKIEAESLLGRTHKNSIDAATDLVSNGVPRAFVTDGGAAAAEATLERRDALKPPVVDVVRLTGAGDTFMAAHIHAEQSGFSGAFAFEKALQAAAEYVSGNDQ